MDYLEAKGDPVSRNLFLEKYRGFVRKVASAHCRRLLEWGRDEELSIALLALDSAIDIYQPQKGAGFDTFASLVIKRRLIDYQRTLRRREREVCVEELPRGAKLSQTGEEFLRLERAAELEEFSRLLGKYGISFADLVKESPRQQGVRERILRAARIIAAQEQLLTLILEKGRLPLEQLSQLTGESKKALANRRRYLLALLAVAARAGDFPFIATYLGLGREEA
ncbi:MAG: sigma-70 family RNA polymerase sigma factor [Bacillota bacterium]